MKREQRKLYKEFKEELESFVNKLKGGAISTKEVRNLLDGLKRHTCHGAAAKNVVRYWTNQVDTELAAYRDKVRKEVDCKEGFFAALVLPFADLLDDVTTQWKMLQMEHDNSRRAQSDVGGTLQDQLVKLTMPKATRYEDYLAELSANGFVSKRQEERLESFRNQDDTLLPDDVPYGVLRKEVIWSRPFLVSHEARFLEENEIEADWSLPGYLIIKNQPVLGINVRLRDMKYSKWNRERMVTLMRDAIARINIEPDITRGCIFRGMGNMVCVGNFVYLPLMPYRISESYLKKWAFSAGWAVGGAKKALEAVG